jgi:hypothetical protein
LVLAPWYDLVCGTVYGYDEFARSIGGENKLGLITRDHWQSAAEAAATKFRLLPLLARPLLKSIRKHVAAVAGRVTRETASPLVNKIAEGILLRAQFLEESLIAH